MKKLATLVATAGILAGILLAAPTTANATVPYDLYVNANQLGNDYGGSCKHADYHYLQDALNNVENNDRIFLCAGTYIGAFYAENGNLTIVGAGLGKTVINGDEDGDPAISVGYWFEENFYADDLTIQNLRITNGYSDDEEHDYWGNGGAVYANNFTCVNSKLDHNMAEQDGGAVYAEGDVSASKCQFSYNQSLSEGGALYVEDSMYDTAGIYTSNRTYDDGGAVYIGGTRYYSSFTKSTFSGNYTCWNNSGFDGEGTDCPTWSNGGAIYVAGDELDVYSSKFLGNEAGNDYGYGGAIYFAAYAEIYTSTFQNNWADYGGAIFGRDVYNADLYLIKNRFLANGAGSDGAAVYTRDDLEIEGNQFKSNYGGGDCEVYVEGWVNTDYANKWGGNQNSCYDF